MGCQLWTSEIMQSGVSEIIEEHEKVGFDVSKGRFHFKKSKK